MSYQWQKGGGDIAGATSASYTTAPSTAADNGSQFRVVVSGSGKSVNSNSASLTVNSNDVVTYHNDNARTGQNLNETTLTPANVNSAHFGKIGFDAVDGKVDGEPLYLGSVTLSNQEVHNVLYVATEHDSLYAFDADSGAQLWKVGLLPTGETTSDSRNCPVSNPEIGVNSTPVIDRARGAIYLVAASKNGTQYFHRLHAIDIASGAELFDGPKEVQATYPGNGPYSSGGMLVFDASEYMERAALLLLDGVVYTTWASHCDDDPYTGWIIGYDAATLAQSSVLNMEPNGRRGAVWMSGAGPAADNSGNIYVLDANGDFDPNLDSQGFPSKRNFGNAFLKISTAGGMTVADYFEMFSEQTENDQDVDLGSGGALVLPDLTDDAGKVWHLAVGGGKDGNMYVVDRDAMGKFTPNGDKIYQEVPTVLSNGVWGMPSYFNNTVYYGPMQNTIRAFPIVKAKLSTSPASQTASIYGYPGATPSISANGSKAAILWAQESVPNQCTGTSCPAVDSVLHAYDATNLAKELYNSSQAGSRDLPGTASKFIPPMITNGKVYVATTSGVAVFGLMPK
ncbi:MAG: pyrrolo-quinoline quinone [Terriglobales bacterium]